MSGDGTVKHRIIRAILAIGIIAGTIAGCTSFSPVYGDRTVSSLEYARFNFAAPDSRIEQIVLDRLKVAFPGPALPTDPLLDVRVDTTGGLASAMSDSFDVGRPSNVRMQATVTIARDGSTIFTATRFSDTSYQGGKLNPVDIANVAGASERAAEAVAESIRAAILAGYRPPPSAAQ